MSGAYVASICGETVSGLVDNSKYSLPYSYGVCLVGIFVDLVNIDLKKHKDGSSWKMKIITKRKME